MRVPRIWLLALPLAVLGVWAALALSSLGSARAPAVAPVLMDDEAAPAAPAPAPAEAEGRFTDEEYEAHVTALRQRLPGEGATIVVQTVRCQGKNRHGPGTIG